MRVAIPPASTVLHPRAAAFTQQASIIERRVGLLFAVTGVALIGVMGVLGLIMRLTQATVLGVSPAWFYRLMTLHGAGMITGALLVMMGGLWYVLGGCSWPMRSHLRV
jgi:heme/copper-type cytochrome/quinol oxidase subunit 1